MENTLVFRKLHIGDVDDILYIDQSSFTSPWTKDAFERELTTNPYAVYIGAELDGKLVAYG